MLALAGALGLWKFSDFWSSANAAKQAVIDTSNKARSDITSSSSKSLQEINGATTRAQQIIGSTSRQAAQQSDELKKSMLQAKSEMSQETTAFRADIESSRSQLQGAKKLQPEMAAMRQQLTQATTAIEAQRKVISSSEEFVKSVFSSHMTDYFQVGKPPENRYAVILPPPNGNRTIVLLLLSSTPIRETLQLQFHVFAQPQNSYIIIHNLVVFSWADSPKDLKTQQLSASYFPDRSDKNIIHSLTEHDGESLRTTNRFRSLTRRTRISKATSGCH